MKAEDRKRRYENGRNPGIKTGPLFVHQSPEAEDSNDEISKKENYSRDIKKKQLPLDDKKHDAARHREGALRSFHQARRPTARSESDVMLHQLQ